MTQTTGAPAYLEALGGFAELVSAVDLIAAVGDDEQALIMYDMTTGRFGTLRAAERLVIREGRILIAGRRHLERALRTYVDHHNSDRPHGGLGLAPPQRRLALRLAAPDDPLRIRRRDRLGGLIDEYTAAACLRDEVYTPTLARRSSPSSRERRILPEQKNPAGRVGGLLEGR